MRRRKTGGRAGEQAKPGTWRVGAAAACALTLTAFVIAGTTPAAHGAAKLVKLAAAMSSIPKRAASPAPAGLPKGISFHGTPAVGALFSTTSSGGLGNHFCTASVVQSPQEDLVLTAAHCVSNRVGTIEFAPGYQDGVTPYGVWTVSKVIVDQAWTSSASINDDVAFLIIAPSKDGEHIQNVTGAERLRFGQPASLPVQVIGYPDGQDLPVICQGRTSVPLPHQLEFDCGAYTNGTSGGPFLLNDVGTGAGQATVIGVIGGYQQGGDTAQISYAAAFGPNVSALYQQAIKQG